MVITETKGSRFELALELLRSGRSVVYRGVGISVDVDGTLECSVQTSWRPENVTEASARQDLASAEAAVAELAGASPAFAALIRGRRRRLVLIDDYGMGTVALAHSEGEALHWASSFRPRD